MLLMAFICFLNCWFIYILNKNMFNIKSAVLLIWGIVLLVNFISPYDWYPMQDNTIFILLLGTFVMNLTFIAAQKFFPPRPDYCKSITIDKKVVKIFYILQIVLVVITIPILAKAIFALAKSGFNMAVLRTMYATGGEGGIYMTTFERLLYIHYVVQPLSYCCIAMDAYLCFMNGFRKKPLIYLLVTMFNVSLITAGRHVILYSIVAISVAYFSTKKDDISIEERRHKKRYYRTIIILAVAITVLITILRSSEDEGFFGQVVQSIVSYFCGGARVFNTVLQNGSMYGLSLQTYGLGFIGGLASIFCFIDGSILGIVGLNLVPKGFNMYDFVHGYLNSPVQYGTSSQMNAFSTMYYYFLRDFGIIGVAILTCLLCLIFVYFENRYYRNPNIMNAALYIHIFFTGIMSVCWFEPIRVEFWMTIFWIIAVNKVLFSHRTEINRIKS